VAEINYRTLFSVLRTNIVSMDRQYNTRFRFQVLSCIYSNRLCMCWI